MLIPSIDLMGGKIVQLVQGKKKALEFSDFEQWIVRFSSYPLVQLIDLDAALGRGDNRALLRQFTTRLPCQVGGGIRSAQAAEAVLASGARRVICGSALVQGGSINKQFAQELARQFGAEKLVFAVDSEHGRVATRGWQETTSLRPEDMMMALEPWCAGFLYTNIETEGLMRGIPFDAVIKLRACTAKQLMVAGGIASSHEVNQLHAIQVDAVVGMAVYTGRMPA